MSYLNRFLSGWIMKRILLVGCFVLLAAVIWFLGPFLGFGEARPLEGYESRIIFLLVALALLLGFWFNVPRFIIFAVIACAAVWVIAPFILIGDGHPMDDPLRRGAIIAFIAFITILYGVWRFMRALALNPALLDNFINPKKNQPEAGPDLSEINAMIRNGINYVRRIHSGIPTWKRFFVSSHWRSELPWFMVMGTKSAGKTSLILSSGQDFPLPEQLNRVGKENLPTSHCECLFSNDALFLDTAGKYIDEGKENQIEWNGILKALKKYRPVKAVNGVIVAISVTDFLGKSKAELLNLSATLRARLDDVRGALGVRFPVYVVMTKLDQLSGFDEYFRNLTAEEREQIWGVTFPYNEEKGRADMELEQRISSELTLLENRISSNMHVRQQEEYSVTDRKGMYALPQDFRMLSQRVTEVLQNVFFASRFDETKFHTTLRGIYFVSSCQPANIALLNNSTLIQKWRNVIGHNKPVSPASISLKNEDEGQLISEAAYGKQYFLKQLFRDVITKDGDLVSYNLKVQSKYRFQNLLGHIVCIGLAVWLVWAFLISFQHNDGYLQAVGTKLEQLESSVGRYVKTTNEQMLPALLNATQQLPEYGTLDVESPDLEWRYGLYTGGVISRGANSLYQFFLQKYLFPMVEHESEVALKSAISSMDNEAVYSALKTYLMLTDEEHFDQDFVVDQVTNAWQKSGKIEPYEEKGIFASHLNRLFTQQGWRQYGQPADSELIKRARAMLAEKTVTARLWDRVQSRLQAEAPANLTLRKMVGENATQVFTLSDDELLHEGVPGLYTHAGYHQVVKKKLTPLLMRLQQEDGWVMGQAASTSLDPLALQQDVLTAYLKEYTNYWKRLLSSVRLISVDADSGEYAEGLSMDIALLRTLVAENSPLLNLAKHAVKETTLVEKAKEKTLLDDVTIRNQGNLINQAKKVQEKIAFRENKLVHEFVDSRFDSLRTFVNGEPSETGRDSNLSILQGTQMSRVIGALNDQYTRLVVLNSAFEYGDIPPMTNGGERMAIESQTWPDPFSNIIAPLLTGSSQKFENKVISQTSKAIDTGIGEICRNTLQGRYPFADSKKVVSLNDFERFFGAGGAVDTYFKKNLESKVDTTTTPWRYKGSASSEGLAFFEQAAVIKNALFNGSEGRKVALDFSVSVRYLAPSITQLIMNFDGNVVRYSHGPITPSFFKWPGVRQGTMVSLTAQRQQASAMPDIMLRGPWALLKWADMADAVEQEANGTQLLTFFMGKDRVELEVSGLTYGNESISELLRSFQCPSVANDSPNDIW
ncbi:MULTISPECIES: type VI secretion system membrane subunit TssM [Yersinia]|uniref:type VI secretion system membrane subunit TssM n=1 Tax=Yersinia TaxID=629 RepID=UPI0009B6F7AE|nr:MULTISPECIES: type VI secretion system membrane subunit TssM [Yersinia]ARB86373.1 type VI secretion system membrane subunit TssM [Yersinia sp. FDAARGOS_228]AVL36229.1 type VI secretion system membrane subunit TssM [Yersinia intermedia]